MCECEGGYGLSNNEGGERTGRAYHAMITFSSFFFFFLKNNFGILFAGLFDIQPQAIFMHGEPGAIVYEVHSASASVSWDVVAKQLFTSATPTPAGY